MRNPQRSMKLMMGAALLLLLAAGAARAQRDYTFTGNDTMNPTNFFSSSNWRCSPPNPSCTFPGPDDTARIGELTSGGGYSIFGPGALGAASVKDLFIQDGSFLNFTNFSVTGTFNLGDLPTSRARIETLTSGGVFNNSGTMNILAQTGNSTFAGSFTFFNHGTVNSWNLAMTGGPTIVNQPAAAFFIHGTGIVGQHTFNNLGNLSKPSSPGTAIITLVNFINSGSVEVGNGTLQIGGAGSSITDNCGRFNTLNAGATLRLLANITTNPCPQPLTHGPAAPGDVATNFFGQGPIQIQGNVTLNDGDLNFGFRHPTSGAVIGGNVEFKSDSITGSGNLRVVADQNTPTVFNWMTGTIGGAGRFDIDTGGIVNVNTTISGVGLSGRTVNNAGTFVLTGSGSIGARNGMVFNNLANGIFEFRGDNGFFAQDGPAALFNNAGIFQKTGGTGVTGTSLVFDNTGLIDVQTGTLRFTSNAPNTSTFSGTMNIADGAVVEFAQSTGGFSFNTGLNFDGLGIARVSAGANITVNGSVTATNFEIDGGTVRGTTGGTGRLTVSGFSRFNDGFCTDIELLLLGRVSVHQFLNGFHFNRALITNQGTTRFQQSVFFNDSSSLFNSGTINAPHNTSLRQNSGVAFLFTNAGTLNPGEPFGTLFMDGNYIQNPTGVLNVDISGTAPGTQFDRLSVFPGIGSTGGTATLSGALNITLVGGFVPSAGESFQIITCQNGCNGQFSQISGVNLPGGKVLIPGYATNAVTLITTTVDSSVNPPTLLSALAATNETILSVRYSGAPNTSYLISIYQGCDEATKINTATKRITTDESGVAQFVVAIPSVLEAGTSLSASATDPNNQTSNLSNCVRVDTVIASLQFSASVYQTTENSGRVEITVTRTGNTGVPVRVEYNTSDGSASERSDYTTARGAIHFDAGQTSAILDILITDDALTEGTETFLVSLNNPSGGNLLGTPNVATVEIADDPSEQPMNPIDSAQFFANQHYNDFLNRPADASGLAFWTGQITECEQRPEPERQACREVRRINVSAAFYLSIEFQETGFFAMRVQRTAFGKKSDTASTRMTYQQLIRDARQLGEGVVVGQPGFELRLEQNRQSYAEQVVSSAEFAARFPATQAAPEYVDALFASATATPTAAERQAAVNAFGPGGAAGRVAALRSVADSDSVRRAEFSPAFVLLQYFGYLRRDPDEPGYQFWLGKLDQFGGNFIDAEMVKAFLTSGEYRSRFGQP